MWKQYRRKGLSEMRPYIPGENLAGISVSDADLETKRGNIDEFNKGMIARNPSNHTDQWYVARQWFDDNYEPVDREVGVHVRGGAINSTIITGNNNITG